MLGDEVRNDLSSIKYLSMTACTIPLAVPELGETVRRVDTNIKCLDTVVDTPHYL